MRVFPKGKQEGSLTRLKDGRLVTEGDIEVLPGTRSHHVSDERRLWPKGIVPYLLDETVSDRERPILAAIEHWRWNTSIRFVERTTESGYVVFANLSGCTSPVGRTGGRQYISVGAGCGTAATTHEIGHTIGLYHEHTRPDRDDFIEVLWENVRNDSRHNFRKRTQTPLTGAYDLRSLMHYHDKAFSANGQPTLRGLAGAVGSRGVLTALDIEAVDRLYPADVDPEPPEPEPPTELLLHDRFRAVLRWETAEGSGDGLAVRIPEQINSGAFAFYDSRTAEVLLNIHDGRELNGFWWVFVAAATDQKWELTILDEETGAEKTYRHAGGEPSPAITDSEAFHG